MNCLLFYEYFIFVTQLLPVNSDFEIVLKRQLFMNFTNIVIFLISFVQMPRYVSINKSTKFDSEATLFMVYPWLFLMYSAICYQAVNCRTVHRLFSLMKSFINGNRSGYLKGSKGRLLEFLLSCFCIFVMEIFIHAYYEWELSSLICNYLIYVYVLVKYTLIVMIFDIMIDIWSETMVIIRLKFHSERYDVNSTLYFMNDINRLLNEIYDFFKFPIFCLATSGFLSMFNNLYFHYLAYEDLSEGRLCQMPFATHHCLDVILATFTTHANWLLMLVLKCVSIFFKQHEVMEKVTENL